MAVITTAVVATVGVISSISAAKKQEQAQQDAINQQRAAAAQSANVIAAAGAAGEKDILEAQGEAAQRVALGAEEAAAQIAPFAEAAPAFEQAKQLTMGGQTITGPLADAIRSAAMAGVDNPTLRQITEGDPVQRELARQAGLSVSAATPDVTQALLTQGTQGIGAVGDIASIRQRGLESLADIAGGTGAGRASVLVGQTPGLQQLAASGQEARLLSDVAGQNFQTQVGESLAKLAGRVI